MKEETAELPNIYQSIKKRLRAQIPTEFISHKTKGANDKIKYLNVTDAKDLLDERVGSANWDAQIVRDSVVGKNYIIIVRIRIFADDGIFDQDGTGIEKVDHSGYGDTASNAYAQAFRRAAEGHGLARELWRGELSEEQLIAPATKEQIAALHDRATALSRTEGALASYYSDKRTELFGELTINEANICLNDTRRFLKKAGSTK